MNPITFSLGHYLFQILHIAIWRPCRFRFLSEHFISIVSSIYLQCLPDEFPKPTLALDPVRKGCIRDAPLAGEAETAFSSGQA